MSKPECHQSLKSQRRCCLMVLCSLCSNTAVKIISLCLQKHDFSTLLLAHCIKVSFFKLLTGSCPCAVIQNSCYYYSCPLPLLSSVFHRFCWDMAADSAPFWEKLGNKSYSCLHAEAHGKILAHFHLNRIEKNGQEGDAFRYMWSGFFFLPLISWRFETDANRFLGDNHLSCIQSQRVNISFNTWFLSSNLPAGTQIHNNPGKTNHSLASLGRKPFIHKDLEPMLTRTFCLKLPRTQGFEVGPETRYRIFATKRHTLLKGAVTAQGAISVFNTYRRRTGL